MILTSVSALFLIEKEYTEEEKAKQRRQAEIRALKELTAVNRDNLKSSRNRRGDV